jgi:uncharacterized protein YabE (DUF348 family)
MVLASLSGTRGRIAVQAAVLATVVGASVAYAAVNKSVTLSIDGKTEKVHAFSATVGDLLEDQGVDVSRRDLVAPGADTRIGDGDTVVVRYARPFDVTVDGAKKTFWTTELSVDGALSSLGLRAEGAAMSASRSTRITRQGMSMWLSTPKRVELHAGGKRSVVTTTAPTVSALLAEQQLSVAPADKLSAVPSSPLREGSVVKLVKITTKRVTTTEPLPFTTTKRKNAKLYDDETKVVRKGRKGARAAVYEVTLADGKATKRTLVSATPRSRPVPQVVEVGTKDRPKPQAASSGDGGGPVGGGADSLNWAALAECESGGDPNAVNRSGPYYGLYQFSASTWRSVGGTGVPTDHGAAEQTYRAKLLYKKAGAGQWPVCGRKL